MIRFFLLLSCAALLGVPSAPTVVSGSGIIEQISTGLTQIQTSDRAIICWRDFSIEPGEIVRFVQPDSSSAVLNRVMGGEASRLMGRLEANGQVYLVNPNGIVIGEGAVIDAGAFFASTFDVLDQSFLEKEELQFSGESQARVINLGRISSPGGKVGLFALYVENQGEVLAGEVSIATTSKIVLREGSVWIDAARSCSLAELEGEIASAGTPYSLAFQHGASTDALEMVGIGGEVSLVGKIEAPEGKISILAENIVAHENSSTSADGGGTVILRAGKQALIYGELSAEGGKGDGGFIEVSAHEFALKGRISTMAPHGRTGTLLIDPSDLTISALATTATFGGACGALTYCSPVGPSDEIDVSDLLAQLALNNVTIDSSAGAGGNGDVFFATPMTWAVTPGGGSTLTVNAFRDIQVVAGNPIDVTALDGNIIFNAGRSILIDDTITFAAGSTSTLVMTAANDITVLDNIDSSGAGAFSFTAGGMMTLGAAGLLNQSAIITGGAVDVNVGSGFLAITGTALGGATINSLASNLTIVATGGDVVFNSTDPGMSSNTGFSAAGSAVITASAGSIMFMSDQNGTTGGGSGDFYQFTAQNDILFSCDNSGRTEIGNSGAGLCTIQTITGDVMLTHLGGQRLRLIQGASPLLVSAARDVVIDGGNGTITSIIGVDPITFQAGRDVLIEATGGGPVFISGAPIVFNVQGDTTFLNTGSNALILNGSTLSVTSGGAIRTSSTSPSGVILAGLSDLFLDSGTSIDIGPITQAGSSDGSVFIRADISVFLRDTSIIGILAPTPASNVTIVVDDQAPNAPLIGSGLFLMEPGAAIMTSAQAPVAIFTAVRGQNIIAGSINGALFAPGTIYVDSASEQWCTYFPNGFATLPMRVYYKDCLPGAAASMANLVVSEMLTDLQPYIQYLGHPLEFDIKYDPELSKEDEQYIIRRRNHQTLIHQPAIKADLY